MYYLDYKESRDLAWSVLINEGVTELPVKVVVLCENMGIRVRYGETGEHGDGQSVMLDGEPWIFVSDRSPVPRQRFTVAHELGHILLGHTGKYQLVNREPDPGDDPIEQAANVFASRLLAPACVLWALDVRSPERIAELCQISHQAAAFRAERMEVLYRRGRFLTSPLERLVYQQFQPFIHSRRS